MSLSSHQLSIGKLRTTANHRNCSPSYFDVTPKIPEKYRCSLNLHASTQGGASEPTIFSGLTNPPSHSHDVKSKATKAGLTFSGQSAFLSHMYKCPVMYKKTPYSSVEQGYHHLHAEFEEMPDISAKILYEHEPREIKIIAANLPKSDGWNQIAQGFMWNLNEAKYEQNPKLKKELIATAPATDRGFSRH